MLSDDIPDIEYIGIRRGSSRSGNDSKVTGFTLHVRANNKSFGAHDLTYRRGNGISSRDNFVVTIGRRPGSDAEPGKAAESDIRAQALFRCPVVSRSHARIIVSPLGEISVQDLGSHHGTYVSRGLRFSEPVTATRRLEDGDTITFGKTVGRDDGVVFPVTTTIYFIKDDSPSRSVARTGSYGLYNPYASSESSSSVSGDDDSVHSSNMRTSDSDVEELLPPPPKPAPSSRNRSSDSPLFNAVSRLLPRNPHFSETSPSPDFTFHFGSTSRNRPSSTVQRLEAVVAAEERESPPPAPSPLDPSPSFPLLESYPQNQRGLETQWSSPPPSPSDRSVYDARSPRPNLDLELPEEMEFSTPSPPPVPSDEENGEEKDEGEEADEGRVTPPPRALNDDDAEKSSPITKGLFKGLKDVAANAAKFLMQEGESDGEKIGRGVAENLLADLNKRFDELKAKAVENMDVRVKDIDAFRETIEQQMTARGDKFATELTELLAKSKSSVESTNELAEDTLDKANKFKVVVMTHTDEITRINEEALKNSKDLLGAVDTARDSTLEEINEAISAVESEVQSTEGNAQILQSRVEEVEMEVDATETRSKKVCADAERLEDEQRTWRARLEEMAVEAGRERDALGVEAKRDVVASREEALQMRLEVARMRDEAEKGLAEGKELVRRLKEAAAAASGMPVDGDAAMARKRPFKEEDSVPPTSLDSGGPTAYKRVKVVVDGVVRTVGVAAIGAAVAWAGLAYT